MRKIGLVGKKVVRKNGKMEEICMYVNRPTVWKWEMNDKCARMYHCPKDRSIDFINSQGAVFYHKRWNRWKGRYVVTRSAW